MIRISFLILVRIFSALAAIQFSRDANPAPLPFGMELSYPTHDFYEDFPNFYNFSTLLIKVELMNDCRLAPVPVANRTQTNYTDAESSAIFINWGEASKNDCYEFAEIVSQLADYSKQLQSSNYPKLKVAVFTSTLESKYGFGNLYHESYGNYFKIRPADVYLSLVAKDHGIILDSIFNLTKSPLLVQIWEDPGPWNPLLQSPGLAAMHWIYLVISIFFLLYIIYRLYCFYLVYQRLLDVRVGIYVASFAYLLIGVCVDTNKVNGSLGQISIYVSWLVGYLAYGGLLLTWSRVVLNMQHRPRNLRPFYILLHFSMCNFTVVIILMILGVTTRIGLIYKIAVILMTNEVPVLFLLNAIFLCYYGCCFLKNVKTMQLSERSKHCMRKLTLLAFATIPGWLLLMLTALLLASSLTSTVAGYVTNMVAYKLAGFQLYGVFFLILTLGESPEANGMQKLVNNNLTNERLKVPILSKALIMN
ncbi:hypothetical protein K7432_003480 [Basidiobolus ranarum]|uniref:Intimal thickness related receptor IRP domain-containing protein n=1 Tax=Basidiobolus ranarum TaxID=34480 RepID=A0ABR2W675_9FUNG